ncbi:RNA polymerase sigma factor [Sphingobacterium spiritivorum]|uniref:RNA polymerase sigma factor n=1 Tax=Sphingobacterium spiritivorum TaxID=258 RepID=UPI003DA322F8
MDQVYIDKILAGDREAFRYFLSTYKDMAFSVAISIVKSEVVAEEVVQDAFVSCYHALKSFQGKSKFSSWLYRIVVNHAFTRLRRIKIEFVPISGPDELSVSDEAALWQLEQKEQAQLIEEALQHLPVNESLALRLFYLEEESIKDVCQITGWTESNAKVILHRARKRIHGILSKLMKS